MAGDLVQLLKTALVSVLEQQRDGIRERAAELDDRAFWCKPLEPGNSVGHLVLHLSGNLNHFVGAQLGGTGYVRDREREFTETAVPSKKAALDRLDDAVATFRAWSRDCLPSSLRPLIPKLASAPWSGH